MNAVAPLSADMPSRLLARCRSTVALSSFGPYRDCRPTTLLTSTCSFAWKASRPSRSRERRAAARCCTHHTEAGVDSDGVCGDGAGVLLPGADDHREWGRRWASKSCEGRAVRSGCAESGRRDAGAAPARKLRINIHACTRHAHTCTHARAHMHTHARSHTHTHTHTLTHSHMCTCTYTCHMYITSSLTQIQLLRLHGGLEGTLLRREIPLRTLLRKNKNKQRRFTETYSFGRQPSGAQIPTIKVVRYDA